MAVAGPMPAVTDPIAQRLFRHILPMEPDSEATPGAVRSVAHFGGSTFRDRSVATIGYRVDQMRDLRAIPRSLLALCHPEASRPIRYSMAHHAPDYYLARSDPPIG